MVASHPHELRRTLGFWALTIYGVGDILGAGIYALVGEIAGLAGSGSWLSFLIAMGVASLTGLSYAELGGRFPRSAGEAVFCERAFGSPAASFVVGWLVLSSGIVSLATVSRACADYAHAFAPWFPTEAAIATFFLLVGGINYWGIRQSLAANMICTAIEIAGLVLVVVAGALLLTQAGPGEPVARAEAPAISWPAVLKGSTLAFFAFIGFEDMVNVSEEVRDPHRNVPRAILTALGIAAALYVLVVGISTSAVPPAELAAADAPLLEVIRRGAPFVPAILFTAVAVFAVGNTGLLNFVTASRLLYGMSRQRLLPAWLSRVHARRRTPRFAILTILVIAPLLALSETLGYLAGTTSVLILLVFLSVNLSLIRIRRTYGTQRGHFTVPLAIPVIAVVATSALLLFVEIRSLVTAGAIVLLGLALVAVARRR